MKSYIYKILLLAIVYGASGCGENKDTTTKNENGLDSGNSSVIKVTQDQFNKLDMQLGALEKKSFPIIISANGMIDVPPENKAVVNATMGGYIKTTPFLIGDKVKKGQTLVTIENPEFISLQQQYMEVNEQLGFLRAEYERHKIMQAENITSQKNFLKAESDYKSAVAKHTGLEKQLKMLNISPTNVKAGKLVSYVTINAPISGSITSVNVTKGTYVSPATPIMEIIDNSHVHLELNVFEKDIMNVKKEQKIIFTIPEASNKKYKAKVHLVGTAIEKNRTIKVHGHLEDEDEENFLTGMFVEAEIITEETLLNALPSTAVVKTNDHNTVLLLDKKEGDTYYFTQNIVKVSNDAYNGYVPIDNSSDFQPDTQFLTLGSYNLITE
ncbi:efflux RND transporter periplasmic adaptor subunit [Maribacter thermophilus]|uniref:efflux RND transporter periplasmic adaptor subunit n=1 Tax=Maribacter thermophilus TaxID=1197874 RepID=UPI0006415E80|nr:efflux RND transporter periplasmic adaptor subunit [Maribacter thermophilus]